MQVGQVPPHQVETPYLYGPFCMQPLLCVNRKEHNTTCTTQLEENSSKISLYTAGLRFH